MEESGSHKALRIRVNETPGEEARICLGGVMNRETVPGVRKRLLRAARQDGLKRLAVDFSGVDRMDTAGVAVMVEVLQVVSHRGRVLSLEGLSEEAKRLFRLARLEETFGVGGEPEAGV